MFFKKEKKQNITHVDEKLQHIAFIMDGNGRWATSKGLPREFGHRKGAEVFKDLVEYCGDIGIKHVTVYAFSTENWKRPKHEIDAIMDLLLKYLGEAEEELSQKNFRIVFLGDKSVFSDSMRQRMEYVESLARERERILNIALNYGSHDEIVYAVNKLISQGKTHITKEDIDSSLYTYQSPYPDLIVRTGGDLRLSNFMLWQAEYAELYFTKTLWPDMTHSDVDTAVKEFYSRKRRYGAL
ncbi:MAG: polyprenyl diphosphate synthase [Clostridia bacterium]|nr:polyprenyl diphosphate synthase [Clostridia bacterium]